MNASVLGDERFRIEAAAYEKLERLEDAVDVTRRIEKPSVAEHMKVVRWLMQMERPGEAMLLSAFVLAAFENPLSLFVSAWVPGVRVEMDPALLQSGAVHQLARAAWKLGIPGLSRFLVRWLMETPNLYEQLDVAMWQILAEVQLAYGFPVHEHLDAYVNLGGNDPVLLRKMLMFYGKEDNADKVDYIVSVLKNLPNLDYKAMEMAKKLEKLGAPKSAIRILSNLERQRRVLDVERQDVLKELIRMKKAAKDWAGLGALVTMWR